MSQLLNKTLRYGIKDVLAKLFRHAVKCGPCGVGTLIVAIGCDVNGQTEASVIDSLKTRLANPSQSDVMVAAHRACWRRTAENSIAAIERCMKLRVDIVELDVRATKDNVLVLMHDETVDRTTDGQGRVDEMSSGDIRGLKLREGNGGDSAELTHYGVPTLREALRAAKGRLLVNLDVKEDIHDRVVEVAFEEGVADAIIIKMGVSGDDPALANAAYLDRIYFMPIVRECDGNPTRFCLKSLNNAVKEYKDYAPVAIEVVNSTDAYLVTGSAAIHESGARLWVNTLGPQFAAGRTDEKSLVDPDGNWGYLIDVGVNIIQTDRPEELMSYLEARGGRVVHR